MEYEEALTLAYKSLEMMDEAGISLHVELLYSIIGDAKAALGDYSQAIKAYQDHDKECLETGVKRSERG